MPQWGIFIIHSCPSCVLVGGTYPGPCFRERVSGASSLLCTGLYVHIYFVPKEQNWTPKLHFLQTLASQNNRRGWTHRIEISSFSHYLALSEPHEAQTWIFSKLSKLYASTTLRHVKIRSISLTRRKKTHAASHENVDIMSACRY